MNFKDPKERKKITSSEVIEIVPIKIIIKNLCIDMILQRDCRKTKGEYKKKGERIQKYTISSLDHVSVNKTKKTFLT